MCKRIKTDREIIQELGVNGLHDITGDRLASLCSMISEIDSNVLSAVISSIPDATDATGKIEILSDSFEEDYRSISENETIRALKSMLEFLRDEASKEKLSSEENGN